MCHDKTCNTSRHSTISCCYNQTFIQQKIRTKNCSLWPAPPRPQQNLITLFFCNSFLTSKIQVQMRLFSIHLLYVIIRVYVRAQKLLTLSLGPSSSFALGTATETLKNSLLCSILLKRLLINLLLIIICGAKNRLKILNQVSEVAPS